MTKSNKTNSNTTKIVTGIFAATMMGVMGFSSIASADQRDGQRGKRGMSIMAPLMQGADVDKDGKITAAELQSVLITHFQAADSDSTGTVNLEEAKAYLTSMAPQKAEGEQDRRGRRDGKRMEKGLERAFEKADADDNGELTEAEFVSAIDDRADKFATRLTNRLERNEERFASMDANGDGQISSEEFEAAAKFGMNGRGGKNDGKHHGHKGGNSKRGG